MCRTEKEVKYHYIFCPISVSGFHVPFVFTHNEITETFSCGFLRRVALCYESGCIASILFVEFNYHFQEKLR